MKEEHEKCRSQDLNLEPPEQKKKKKADDHRTKKPCVRFIKFRQKCRMFSGCEQSTNCTVCTAIDGGIKHQRPDEKVDAALK